MKVNTLEQYSDVIVIGGGASGMVAAVKAAEKSRSVLLLEKAERTGRKILASGNGRCNLMNSGQLRYYGDCAFARDVFRHCNPSEICSFFRYYGLVMTEEEGRIYPVTYQAATVHSVLRNALLVNGVNMKVNSHVVSAEKNCSSFLVTTAAGEQYSSRALVIACGGAAQPKLGGVFDGYRLIESFGHTMIPIRPALVPLVTDSRSISGLSGIRIRCRVHVLRSNETIHSEEGEVLFTDYGISGICIMQCARFADLPGTSVSLDFMSGIFPDRDVLISEMKRRKILFSSSSPVWLLNGILPEKIAYAVLKQAGLPMKGEKASEIRDEMISCIADAAYRYIVLITGTRGFDYAQVTAGGVDCSEFDPSTMCSRIVPDLYAAGELLNVDGDCGGYNLMFAFATGLIAGSSVSDRTAAG